MEEDILEDLMACITDRLGRVYNQNEEYRQALETESRAYEQLKRELTEIQRDQLDQYFVAAKATSEICEKLAYQEGIRGIH